jgi:hypothetical protein
MYRIAVLSFCQAHSEVTFEFPPVICLVSREWGSDRVTRVERRAVNLLKGNEIERVLETK